MLKFLFLLMFLIGCTGNSKTEKDTPTDTSPAQLYPWTECSNQIGSHVCNMELIDQHGNQVDLYQYYGRPIVLDFSAGWCYYCIVAAAEAQSIQDSFNDINLVYLTVLIENRTGGVPDPQYIAQWITDNNIIDAPVYGGSRDLLGSDVNISWPVSGWPTFYFIDKDMILRAEMRGYSQQGLNLLITDNL